MTLILGFSGKKQSGKTTSGNFIVSLCMSKLGLAGDIKIDNNGKIIVSDLLGNRSYKGIYDAEQLINDTDDYILMEIRERLNPYIKIYNFADTLKKDICINILGLSRDQCYGNEDAKNSLTSLELDGAAMTAREVMQYIGTDIFRKLSPNIWADATIRKIQREAPKIAIITDCRFPNEVDIIKNSGGHVIRLTRSPYESDHISENILDKDQYDWNNFSFVIDNDQMSIYEQCMEIQNALKEVLSL